MKKLLFLFLFATSLFAQNPRVYGVLGDVIYDNVQAIEKLKEIPQYEQEIEKIDNYTKEVRRVKRDGFAIDSGDNTVDKSKYLNELRELSKTNDSFNRSVKSNFLFSIESADSDLFLYTVNSGLLDTEMYKKEIIEYYYNHSNYLNASGILQDIIGKDEAIKSRVKNNRVKEQELEKEKIKRIRQKDRAEQDAVKKLLDDEAKEKKKKIIENQKKELSDN